MMNDNLQERLIAELLGDVGKLRDEIQSLPDVLRPSLDAVNRLTQESAEALRALTEVQHTEI
jgi:hypothetical protein